jgi:hypothetical protein
MLRIAPAILVRGNVTFGGFSEDNGLPFIQCELRLGGFAGFNGVDPVARACDIPAQFRASARPTSRSGPNPISRDFPRSMKR